MILHCPCPRTAPKLLLHLVHISSPVCAVICFILFECFFECFCRHCAVWRSCLICSTRCAQADQRAPRRLRDLLALSCVKECCTAAIRTAALRQHMQLSAWSSI